MALRTPEWHKLPVSLTELCINTTLRCGQSFRYNQLISSHCPRASSDESTAGESLQTTNGRAHSMDAFSPFDRIPTSYTTAPSSPRMLSLRLLHPPLLPLRSR